MIDPTDRNDPIDKVDADDPVLRTVTALRTEPSETHKSIDLAVRAEATELTASAEEADRLGTMHITLGAERPGIARRFRTVRPAVC